MAVRISAQLETDPARREITVPIPIAVGMNEAGRIVLEYEDTEENREMARRVAGAMG